MPDPGDHRRFLDYGEDIFQYMDEFLVVCPGCSACARVAPMDPACTGLFAPRRATCLHCGFAAEWRERRIGRSCGDLAEDVYLHLPLWLQAPCCGHVLWAYNARHLAVLRDYVGAGLRLHRRDPETGWGNRSLLGRLPRWLQSAGNRAAVLKAIAKLEKKLKDAGLDGTGAR